MFPDTKEAPENGSIYGITHKLAVNFRPIEII
jgi:hypothetical protein